MAYSCGLCGDSYEERHDCWLAKRGSGAEDVEPLFVGDFTPLGPTEADSRIPERIRRVDISCL